MLTTVTHLLHIRMVRFRTLPGATCAVLCDLQTANAGGATDPGSNETHPLMPGIRSPEIRVTDWPRTLHDKQLTGFSPLTLGMPEAC